MQRNKIILNVDLSSGNNRKAFVVFYFYLVILVAFVQYVNNRVFIFSKLILR